MEQQGQVPPSTEQTDQEKLRREYEEAAVLGRKVIEVTRGRAIARFTPFLDAAHFLGDDIKAVDKKEENDVITPEDVKKASLKSFALSLEAATQIGETAARMNQRQVRDDPDSLEDLAKITQAGFQAQERLDKEGLHQETAAEVKAVLSRRIEGDDKTILMTDEEALEWSKKELRRTNATIRQKEGLLRAYFGI